MMGLLFIFFLCFFPVNSTNNLSGPRLNGLTPAQQKMVQDASTLSCDDNSRVIPIDQVNDDYCDCNDGSDEPGTSACAGSKVQFFCINKKSASHYISTSVVNDGICDCCDGSDEYASEINCLVTCDEEGEVYRAERKKLALNYEDGLRTRDKYASKAFSELQIVKEDALKLKNTLNEKESLQQKAHEKKQVEEEIEKKEAEVLKQNIPYEIMTKVGLLDFNITQLQNLVFELMKEKSIRNHGIKMIDLLREESQMEKSIIRKEEDEFDRNKNEEEEKTKQDEEAKREEKDKINKEQNNDMDEEMDNDEKDNNNENVDDNIHENIEEDKYRPIHQLFNKLDVDWHIRSEAEKAREQYNSIAREYDEILRKYEKAIEISKIDYGPDDVYYALKGECFSTKSGQYTYQICFYESSRQDATSLGKWNGFQENYTQISFTNGQKCWNGPDRSMTVHLECGSINELYDIDETETCVYKSKMKTPAACERKVLESLVHDEL